MDMVNKINIRAITIEFFGFPVVSPPALNMSYAEWWNYGNFKSMHIVVKSFLPPCICDFFALATTANMMVYYALRTRQFILAAEQAFVLYSVKPYSQTLQSAHVSVVVICPVSLLTSRLLQSAHSSFFLSSTINRGKKSTRRIFILLLNSSEEAQQIKCCRRWRAWRQVKAKLTYSGVMW